jgi:hypothetical protein
VTRRRRRFRRAADGRLGADRDTGIARANGGRRGKRSGVGSWRPGESCARRCRDRRRSSNRLRRRCRGRRAFGRRRCGAFDRHDFRRLQPATPPRRGPAPHDGARRSRGRHCCAGGARRTPPRTNEIESLFAAFVESYERGRVDVFADLFDVDAETNLRQGRPAIRGEYDELFRLSQWRKMQLTRVNWKRVGNRAVAKGEVTVRIGWRDGREVEQRLALDMELVRRDGRVVIARLSQQPRP